MSCHFYAKHFQIPGLPKKSSASLSGPLPVLVSFFAEKVEQSGTSEALGQIPQHDLGQTNRFRPHEQRSRKKCLSPDFPLVATAKETVVLCIYVSELMLAEPPASAMQMDGLNKTISK